jgi:hypothetical protein
VIYIEGLNAINASHIRAGFSALHVLASIVLPWKH